MTIRKTAALPGDRKLHLSIGDVQDEPVDAIVNAANSHLARGGGVAAAISRAAGPALDAESFDYVRDNGPVPIGCAVATTAGNLPYKGVIHAVGPSAGMEYVEEKLTAAIASALRCAQDRGWRSVAIPAVSSGIFGVSAEICARAYLGGILKHLSERPSSCVSEVRLTLWLGAQGGSLVHYVERAMDAINTWADLDVLQSFLDRRVVVGIGDLVKQQVDAIVNAANARLLGGGGVDGAIHEAGGPRILKECRAIRESRFPQGLPTGQVVITTGGLLPVRHVIHTVGPIFGSHQGRESELLAACYQNSLAVAVEHRLRHVAFPAISTGAFCYPPHEAAAVSSRAVAEFLAGDTSLEQVRFVFLFQEEAEVFLHHHRFPE